MSEEEKKAIEIIKQEITKPETTPLEVYVTDIKMLLHIIDKQQKEIEELKEITRAYDGMQGIMPEGHPIIIADKEYFDSGRFTEKYISKDKIREKIKELEENNKRIKKQYKDGSQNSLQNYFENKEQIKILKKLL